LGIVFGTVFRRNAVCCGYQSENYDIKCKRFGS